MVTLQDEFLTNRQHQIEPLFMNTAGGVAAECEGGSGSVRGLNESGSDLPGIPKTPGTVSPGVNSQNNRNMCYRVGSHRPEMKKKYGYVGIDWLQGSVGYNLLPNVVSYFSDFLEIKPVAFEYGEHRYNRTVSFHPFGIKIFYDSTGERSKKLHNYRIMLQITGTGLSYFSSDDLVSLVRVLFENFHFCCTRIDLFYDDESKRITPLEIQQIAKMGNVTGFRKGHYDDGTFEIGRPDSSDGSGMYFGSRGKNGGGKYMRIYDKELESKGEIKAIRWEIEYGKNFAELAFLHLYRTCDDLRKFTLMVGSLITGAIAFVNRQAKPGEKNIPRLEVLDFWRDICEELGSVRLRNPRKESTIQKTAGWVEKSVFSPLVKLLKAFGDEKFYGWLLNGLDEKQDGLTVKQYNEIQQYWRFTAEKDDIPI